ncbi:sulfite exporter TauE/SafE family protein [Microbulbifer agarilyticus]|uniref:sulfite exporter TauE/SafE family protein n=1 Tax=Microbulbifer agarilyticus TaxID=260552 RepID=UPI001CD3BBB0|nr:sulfite exporter TauE/SafE family protein [Microbulbifer agarilyticus]MCA0900497.1 sulfite exporter TauE/SafE family protein [Microbulbifer agarilyticus]
MADWSFLAAALAIGFLGSSHCIGMCGGISGALGLAVPGEKPQWPKLLGYSAGRIASYALMGLLVGSLGAFLAADLAAGLAPLRTVAGVMLIAMALYLADWWRGLVWLERGGAVLWRAVQPLSRHLLPVKSTPQAVALGAVWGWLPCGLVYSALTFALAQGSGQQAALAMIAFGLGTAPAVLASGMAATRLRKIVQKPGVRLSMASLVLVFGVWTLWGTVGHGAHGAHDSHSARSAQEAHSGHDQHATHSGAETREESSTHVHHTSHDSEEADPVPEDAPAEPEEAPAEHEHHHHHH